METSYIQHAKRFIAEMERRGDYSAGDMDRAMCLLNKAIGDLEQLLNEHRVDTISLI